MGPKSTIGHFALLAIRALQSGSEPMDILHWAKSRYGDEMQIQIISSGDRQYQHRSPPWEGYVMVHMQIAVGIPQL